MDFAASDEERAGGSFRSRPGGLLPPPFFSARAIWRDIVYDPHWRNLPGRHAAGARDDPPLTGKEATCDENRDPRAPDPPQRRPPARPPHRVTARAHLPSPPLRAGNRQVTARSHRDPLRRFRHAPVPGTGIRAAGHCACGSFCICQLCVRGDRSDDGSLCGTCPRRGSSRG